jgi:hypothetical protein
MILLFKLIVLTVIIVLALRVALSEGMLLEKLGSYFERKVDEGNRFFDIFICPWCSGTLQSLTAHAFAFGLGILPFEWNWQLLIRWPLVVFASSFISGVLWTVYLTLNQIKEKNQAEAEYLKYVNSVGHADDES